MKKPFRLLLKIAALLVPLYFFPRVMLFFILCGVYDVARNKNLNTSVVDRYFFGNGILTWVLSPFNILMDILTLPYWNKGVYQLTDLPRGHQEEIQRLIDTAHRENLVEKLEEKTKSLPRAMFFFQWYGAKAESPITVPAYQETFRYVQTIGVSVFNKKQSTSKHFGPLRATLRVLYNINDTTDDLAYIVVGNVTHYWRENKLFIFDDTLQHQSFNESDQARYCLFVDILRPALSPAPLALVVRTLRFFLSGINAVFYKNWKVVKN